MSELTASAFPSLVLLLDQSETALRKQLSVLGLVIIISIIPTSAALLRPHLTLTPCSHVFSTYIMGVRGLTKHLLPYAEWKALGTLAEVHSAKPCHEAKNIVIDGPSLAFFIYRRLFAHNLIGSSILDSIPSYRVLGGAVVAFLQQLQSCGLIM